MCFIISTAEGHVGHFQGCFEALVCRRVVTPGVELPADWFACVQL